MHDKVEIQIGKQRIEYFKSYSIPANIFNQTDGFEFSLPDDYAVETYKGQELKAFINGEIVLTGIIEKVLETDSKSGISVTISGRDILGLAVDGYIENFKSFNGQSLENTIKEYFKPVELLNRAEIVFEKNSEKFNISKAYSKAEIGDSIINRVTRLVTPKRLLLFADEKGRVVFAKIPTDPKEDFKIFRSKTDPFKNVITAERNSDITGKNSEVIIYSQSQSGENLKATYKRNDDFPIRKVFVGKLNEDGDSAKEQARAIVEDQRKGSLNVNYTVAGHSQNGKVWQVRKGTNVKDDRFEISKTMLIIGRTFLGTKDTQTTALILGEYAER